MRHSPAKVPVSESGERRVSCFDIYDKNRRLFQGSQSQSINNNLWSAKDNDDTWSHWFGDKMWNNSSQFRRLPRQADRQLPMQTTAIDRQATLTAAQYTLTTDYHRQIDHN